MTRILLLRSDVSILMIPAAIGRASVVLRQNSTDSEIYRVIKDTVRNHSTDTIMHLSSIEEEYL